MNYPSVTQVLGVYADFTGVKPEVLAHAAARGTAVHAACHAHITGLWVPPLDDEVQPYFDSFRRWADAMVTAVHAAERRMVDDVNGYTGQPDLSCTLRGDSISEITVVDYKTPSTKSRLWAAQLAAYGNLCAVTIGEPKRLASLRLKRDGGRAIFDEYTRSHQDLAAFLAALTAYKWFKG